MAYEVVATNIDKIIDSCIDYENITEALPLLVHIQQQALDLARSIRVFYMPN
jgi:hypothetical protein